LSARGDGLSLSFGWRSLPAFSILIGSLLVLLALTENKTSPSHAMFTDPHRRL
jgi:hypothetical protein